MSIPHRVVKVVCIGDSNTGKSSIVQTFINKNTNIDRIETTVGVDFATKHLTIRSKKVRLTIWDTAGQERFRSLTYSYYRGAEVLLIVYDVTNRISFDNIQFWLDEAYESIQTTNPILVLVGNKIDLDDERKVDRKEGLAVAKKNQMLFIETSARTHDKIAQPFLKALKKIDLERVPDLSKISLLKAPPKGYTYCCA